MIEAFDAKKHLLTRPPIYGWWLFSMTRYVGEGARMVRELFEMARTKKACIIFFDEVDAIGGTRFDDGAGGDNEVQRTMLELINQLDGFDPRGNIKVLMATNRYGPRVQARWRVPLRVASSLTPALPAGSAGWHEGPTRWTRRCSAPGGLTVASSSACRTSRCAARRAFGDATRTAADLRCAPLHRVALPATGPRAHPQDPHAEHERRARHPLRAPGPTLPQHDWCV